MSQNTETPELGQKLKWWGQGSDTLNLPLGSREIDLNVAMQCPRTETNNMKQLMNEFKGLYEERLRRLELNATESQEEILHMKVCVLQSYVNDLADQNQVLVQTIEDLEKEADHKVSSLGMKLCTSDGIMDVLRTLSLDETGPVAHIPNVPELEDVQIQLNTEDLITSGLERRLTWNLRQKKEVLEGGEELPVSLQGELSRLQQIQENNMKELAEKDVSIAKLHAHIRLLQQEGADTHTQVSKLNERVKELQEEVKRKEEERRAAEEEWRRREDQQRRRRQEQRKREEEWKRGCEEERAAHAQAIKKWAERAAILTSELEASRKQVERQRRELSELHQKEETLLSELQAQERRLCDAQKTVRLREGGTAQLQRQLEDTRRAHVLATQQVGDLQQKLMGQSKELEETQHHYQDSVEDNARLRTQLNTHTLSACSQQQILTSELRSAEGQLHALERQLQDKQNELESAALKMVCLESSLREAEQSCADAKTEVQNHSLLLEEMARELERVSVAEKDAALQVKEREERVKHLDQDVVALRVTQDSLKRTLAMKEKHAEQLVQDNSRLKDSLAALQSKLQTSECMVSDISETLEQVKTSQNQERQQIQEQLLHANREVERLQRELTQLRRAAEKKIQKREVKMSALVKELAESKKQHSDCQRELLGRESASERLREERDELRAKMEEQSRERVSLSQAKGRLETELALSHEKHCTTHLEVRSRDQLILQLRAEMKTAEQKHQGTQEELSALEAEVRRLKQKVRSHQEEACQLREKIRDGEGLRDQKQKERQQLHDRLSISQQQGEAAERLIKKQKDEMDLLRQQLKGAQEDLKEASVQAQDQEETVTIFKQKYIAAMEKVHRVQGQVESLEEELRYSQQQLRESQVATRSVKAELAELEGQYQEKVGQWESSQEALDQLTDELQANQNLLRESRQKVGQCEGLMATLQEQVDTLKQQKLMLDSDLRLYQQTHSHCDEEYLGLLRHRQQLQKRCTEQVGRLAECEKAALQMKTELERQSQEKAGLERSLVASHHTHLSNRSHLVQEVTRLEQEVTRLELQLSDTQKDATQREKIHDTLLRQSQEDLKEARQETARRSREVEVQKEQVWRLQETLQKEEEQMRSGLRENQSLRSHIKQLSRELEELRSKHQRTVEELAARAEEARRMAGCLNEGKLAEEKIRSVAERFEKEVTELEKALQQAVDRRLTAEREKQDAHDQEDGISQTRVLLQTDRAEEEEMDELKVDALRLELEGTRSDNANLRHESQLVMTNVSRWITEQKTSSESLAAQIKAQKKVLVIITEEKKHLQEANGTLKEEVKKLQEVAEKKSGMECFKAQIQDQGTQREEGTKERESCVALNLCKIEDMQTRLRSNLEAIGMLNQQLSALGGENERLRRQLEEERSVRRQAERLLPPPPPPPPPTHQRCSSVHLPLPCTARPPLHPLGPDSATRDTSRILTRTQLSTGGPERPGESCTLGETLWRSLAAERSASASPEDVWSGRRRRDLTK